MVLKILYFLIFCQNKISSEGIFLKIIVQNRYLGGKPIFFVKTWYFEQGWCLKFLNFSFLFWIDLRYLLDAYYERRQFRNLKNKGKLYKREFVTFFKVSQYSVIFMSRQFSYWHLWNLFSFFWDQNFDKTKINFKQNRNYGKKWNFDLKKQKFWLDNRLEITL